jgi:hypothetical protein
VAVLSNFCAFSCNALQRHYEPRFKASAEMLSEGARAGMIAKSIVCVVAHPLLLRQSSQMVTLRRFILIPEQNPESMGGLD